MADKDDCLRRALDLAYGQLNRRDRTVAEVRRFLRQRGEDAAASEGAIRMLIDQRYLDDARFARMFAQGKRELDQWGIDRIRRTLLDRGIDRELIEQTLRAQPEGELDRALGLLRRRFPDRPRDRRERDRALGVMIRKGYDSEVALDALAAYARDDDRPDLR